MEISQTFNLVEYWHTPFMAHLKESFLIVITDTRADNESSVIKGYANDS